MSLEEDHVGRKGVVHPIGEAFDVASEGSGPLTALDEVKTHLVAQAELRLQIELEAFRKERNSATATAQSATNGGSNVRSKVANAESAFDRMMARHVGLPGQVGVGDPKDAARLAELEKMSREHRIQERLAALKAHKHETD